VRLDNGDARPDDRYVLMVFQVDAVAVAEALGYGNPKSLGNRWSAMKKKYDLRVELSFTRPGVRFQIRI
jgi:hypothetical protein